MRARIHATAETSRSARGRSRGAFCLLACVLVVGWGCSTGGWLGGGATRPAEGDEVVAIGFGDWTKDTIHCAEGRCDRRYAIEVTKPGRLRAEVYAPLDEGGPDFSLVLLDAAGEAIARPAEDDARPRRLALQAEPGTYSLRVAARGENLGPLRYDVVVFLDPPRETGTGRRVERPAPPPPPPSPPPPPPAPSDHVIRAEVLDVEAEEGGEVYVLLDRGEPHGVRKSMEGELRVGDEPIGRFVIVEVYRDGSRARIEGDLRADIGIDTVAEIHP